MQIHSVRMLLLRGKETRPNETTNTLLRLTVHECLVTQGNTMLQ